MSKTLLAMLVEQLPEWRDGDGEFAYWSPGLPDGGGVRFVNSKPKMCKPIPECAAPTEGVWVFKGGERPVDAETSFATRSLWLEAKHAKKQDAWAEQQAKKYPAYWREIPADWRFIDTYRINQLFPVNDDTGAILHARKKLILAGVRTGGKSLDKDLREAVSTLECKLNG